ncbi:MAG: serine protease [Paludibacteraceae bacterium]|nr:serine protease [Paludibacteraceae bacterium]
MFHFMQDMPGLLQAYWIIALAASLIFVIQTVLSFIGLDADTDTDVSGADVDLSSGDVPGMFTFRNLISFLLGYGWSGVCFYSLISSVLWLNVVNVAVGLLFVLTFFLIISQIMKLGKDASFRIQQSVGLNADVYLRIPARRSGTGKVQVSVNGTVHELDAVTDGEELPTAGKVHIDSVIDSSTVLVSRG